MPTTAAYRLLVKTRTNREISEILPATSLLFIVTGRVSVPQTDFSQVLYVGRGVCLFPWLGQILGKPQTPI
jgi:hypothetical protein